MEGLDKPISANLLHNKPKNHGELLLILNTYLGQLYTEGNISDEVGRVNNLITRTTSGEDIDEIWAEFLDINNRNYR